jgi:hypothetical protein
MVDERRDDFGAPLDDDSPSMDALNGSMDVGPLDDDDIDDIMSQPGKAGPGEIALDARPKIHAASLSSADGGGTWMYATAPGIIKGAVKPGYDVIIAYGEDRNDVEVRICVLMIAETADGRWQSLKFRKANAIKIEGGKVAAAGAMEEAMVVGALDGRGVDLH